MAVLEPYEDFREARVIQCLDGPLAGEEHAVRISRETPATLIKGHRYEVDANYGWYSTRKAGEHA